MFIGISVVETLLFDCLRDNTVADPVAEVFARIKNFGLHHPGFILYPLHSFGIMGLGFATFLTGSRIYFTDERAGIAIFPQNNSDEVFMQSVKDGMKALKIRRTLPVDTIEHFLRQGPLKWMRYNPIMMVRARAFSGTYYENQFLLVVRLQFATGYVMMLTCFQKAKGDEETRRLLSSSHLNNFETLNLKHYLVFQTAVHRPTKLDARRVPMNLAAAQLAELADLNVELDPNQHTYQKKVQKDILKALADAEAGYLDNCIEKSSKTVKAKVFRKLFTSLGYFRKSFRETSVKEENTISLAVAFETLLTDGYAKGVTERIHRRVRIALKGIPGNRRMSQAVKVLFKSRGASVHDGVSETEPDWRFCRQAFVHCFTFVIRKSNKAASTSNEPMRDILGDT